MHKLKDNINYHFEIGAQHYTIRLDNDNGKKSLVIDIQDKNNGTYMFSGVFCSLNQSFIKAPSPVTRYRG